VAAQVLARNPTGRYGRPEEVAQVVMFLASPAAAYINGIALPIDGGRMAF
jgi:NAD(P)-dependent dehydrogenase (short-subunit alcohol dehydrogenase family)